VKELGAEGWTRSRGRSDKGPVGATLAGTGLAELIRREGDLPGRCFAHGSELTSACRSSRGKASGVIGSVHSRKACRPW